MTSQAVTARRADRQGDASWQVAPERNLGFDGRGRDRHSKTGRQADGRPRGQGVAGRQGGRAYIKGEVGRGRKPG
jgi:hypothetical protein